MDALGDTVILPIHQYSSETVVVAQWAQERKFRHSLCRPNEPKLGQGQPGGTLRAGKAYVRRLASRDPFVAFSERASIPPNHMWRFGKMPGDF